MKTEILRISLTSRETRNLLKQLKTNIGQLIRHVIQHDRLTIRAIEEKIEEKNHRGRLVRYMVHILKYMNVVCTGNEEEGTEAREVWAAANDLRNCQLKSENI